MIFRFWTSEKIWDVAEMVALCMPSSQIARKINDIYGTDVTKNSIIGICRREGIKFRGHRPKSKKKRGSPQMRATVARIKGHVNERDVLEVFQEYHGGEKLLEDIKPGECTFPLECGDGHVFCGKRRHRESYCQHHYEICYKKTAT